jgi:hypothetical protein
MSVAAAARRAPGKSCEIHLYRHKGPKLYIRYGPNFSPELISPSSVYFSMSSFLTRIKDQIEEKRLQSRQHDFVAEVAPSRLNATRTSLDLGHRRNRSFASTSGSAITHLLRRSNSHATLGQATAGGDALDLEIRFIAAYGLPRMDMVGVGCDPYFRAEIDDAITYT